MKNLKFEPQLPYIIQCFYQLNNANGDVSLLFLWLGKHIINRYQQTNVQLNEFELNK